MSTGKKLKTYKDLYDSLSQEEKDSLYFRIGEDIIKKSYKKSDREFLLEGLVKNK